MEKTSAPCFQLWMGTLMLLLMEVALSSQNKLLVLLHFRFWKHSPSCLGEERSVESQLFCCSNFHFVVTIFHQQISYHFGVSSTQHKEPRLFFHSLSVVLEASLKLMGKERSRASLFSLTLFKSLVKASGACCKLVLTGLQAMPACFSRNCLWASFHGSLNSYDSESAYKVPTLFA